MATDKPTFELTDIQSATWQKLRQHIEARIDLLRRKNDHDADERATARLRGRIDELNSLLLSVEPKPMKFTRDE